VKYMKIGFVRNYGEGHVTKGSTSVDLPYKSDSESVFFDGLTFYRFSCSEVVKLFLFFFANFVSFFSWNYRNSQRMHSGEGRD
jgi:hypothetical protein